LTRKMTQQLLCYGAAILSSGICTSVQADSLNPGSGSAADPSAPSMQYGSIQQQDQQQDQQEPHTSFRLKRPAGKKMPPQLSQPADAFPNLVNPELNQLFPAQAVPDTTFTPPINNPNNMWHPGIILTGSAGEQALSPTCDLNLAAQQAQQFPTSPEAAFIYAVALTKTSEVERALKEVRRARNLAQATGDPNYFSRAVGQYEGTLKAEPNNNCIRYGLGWGYYMQAYLFAERARKEASNQAILAGQAPRKTSKLNKDLFSGAAILESVLTGTRPDASVVPHIPGALENTPSWALPQIKIYYQKSLANLDEVVRRDPKDVWAAVYGAHVREEYDGEHQIALDKLTLLKKNHPDNPAAAFFLADAYARSGNIVAGAGSLSQALKLKLQGK
jgi:tetratricopeptide (TPR) repeat protein